VARGKVIQRIAIAGGMGTKGQALYADGTMQTWKVNVLTPLVANITSADKNIC